MEDINMLSIDYERCKGCGLCAAESPKKILALNSKRLNLKGYNPVDIIDPEACIRCAMCATMCPDVCITVSEKD